MGDHNGGAPFVRSGATIGTYLGAGFAGVIGLLPLGSFLLTTTSPFFQVNLSPAFLAGFTGAFLAAICNSS